MSFQSETGSAASTVQKWIIDSDVENLLRSGALKRRIQDWRLPNGSVELHMWC